MITDIEKNKQMSEIKVEPEELCGSTVTQIVETQSTCSTTGLFSIKSKTLFFVKYQNFLTGNQSSDLRSIINAHIETTELKTDDLSSDKNSNCSDTQLKGCIGNCFL